MANAVTHNVWHEGERAMQESIGVQAQLADLGPRVLRSFMPDQHRAFFAQLPFLVVGSVDEAGAPWASMVTGEPGFIHSPDPQQLVINAMPMPGDPLRASLHQGERLGLLGIELPTRRRNRMNGAIAGVTTHGFSVSVEQSFGNCPKYIQSRDYGGHHPAQPIVVEPVSAMDAEMRQVIARSDTFFVASYSPDGDGQPAGVDVSHRGGLPGFIKIDDEGVLTIPDFSGNRFFNTLGNLLINPRAGLLFIDFATGDLLQLTGDTEIIFEGADLRDYPGAERLWRFAPRQGRWLRHAFPLETQFHDLSPASIAAGLWSDAAR